MDDKTPNREERQDASETINESSSSVTCTYLNFQTLEPAAITDKTILYIAPIGTEYRISAVEKEFRQHFETDPISRAPKIWIIQEHKKFLDTLNELDKINTVFPFEEEHQAHVLTNNTFPLKEIRNYCKDFDSESLVNFTLRQLTDQQEPAPVTPSPLLLELLYRMGYIEAPEPDDAHAEDEPSCMQVFCVCWLSCVDHCSCSCWTQTLTTILETVDLSTNQNNLQQPLLENNENQETQHPLQPG